MRRIREEIVKEIAEIENDSRYKSGQVRPATLAINAPLALIQLEMETRLKVLRRWLNSLEATPLKPITKE